MTNSDLRKFKTSEQIRKEIGKRCMEVNKLSEDVKICRSFEARRLMFDRMTVLADEVSKLNTRQKQILLKETKQNQNNILKNVFRMILKGEL